MARIARTDRAAFRDAHALIIKAAKLLRTNPTLEQFSAGFLEELEAWSPDYFSTEAVKARRLLRRGGGTFPIKTPGYRKPRMSAMDRGMLGEEPTNTPTLSAAGH